MIEQLQKITLDQAKSGCFYDSEKGVYTCLICGCSFAEGEVFTINGRFFEAEKAAQMHIRQQHGRMIDILTSFDKKYTGLTDNQKELMLMLHDGLPDSEIARKTGVAPATIRHQRFVFREKAKQAKLYLAIYELAAQAAGNGEDGCGDPGDLIDIPNGAKMTDDRYAITKAEEEKILASAFCSFEPLVLKTFSPKEKKKIVILKKIAGQFERDRRYTEKEVNAILRTIFDDYATIRRYLIEYGFMMRTKNCEEYWMK